MVLKNEKRGVGQHFSSVTATQLITFRKASDMLLFEDWSVAGRFKSNLHFASSTKHSALPRKAISVNATLPFSYNPEISAYCTVAGCHRDRLVS